MTQQMTSECSGFSLADLILAPGDSQAGRVEGLVFIREATNHSLLSLSLCILKEKLSGCFLMLGTCSGLLD